MRERESERESEREREKTGVPHFHRMMYFEILIGTGSWPKGRRRTTPSKGGSVMVGLAGGWVGGDDPPRDPSVCCFLHGRVGPLRHKTHAISGCKRMEQGETHRDTDTKKSGGKFGGEKIRFCITLTTRQKIGENNPTPCC